MCRYNMLAATAAAAATSTRTRIGMSVGRVSQRKKAVARVHACVQSSE